MDRQHNYFLLLENLLDNLSDKYCHQVPFVITCHFRKTFVHEFRDVKEKIDRKRSGVYNSTDYGYFWLMDF